MSVLARLAPRTALTGSALACLLALGACATAPEPITRYGDAATVYATGAKVAAGSPLYFSAGMTAGEGAPASMKGQALLTLKKLGDSLTTAGIKPSEVLFVRAYLAPGADGKVDFAGWNEAWAETFGNAANPVKPARTTVAVPLLGRPTTLIEIEYVAATAPADGLFMSSDKLGLPVSNPMLKPYGTKEGRIYSGMGIKAGAGYYWTAGTLSAPAKADAPATSAERYGDMKFQARSTLKRLQENLAAVGLSFKDVIFLRAFLAPNKFGDGQFDYAGWNAAYDEFFNNPANPHKPARTTVTTPSFGGPGAQIEVEVITAFPGVPQASVNFDASTPATVNPNIKSYGAAASPIASGKALKPGSSLYFSAGAVPAVDGDMKTQALSTLGVLKERLAAAGMGFKDVLFLRAYVVPEADGNFDRKGWGEAYSTFFGTADQPQKPARTTIAVHSLPRPNWKIEIDVIAAQP
jgi:enamine deaminase RidA (YjgF/YER057c/UK114 family)